MSGSFQIRGGKKLHGEITPQGAKKVATKSVDADWIRIFKDWSNWEQNFTTMKKSFFIR